MTTSDYKQIAKWIAINRGNTNGSGSFWEQFFKLLDGLVDENLEAKGEEVGEPLKLSDYQPDYSKYKVPESMLKK